MVWGFVRRMWPLLSVLENRLEKSTVAYHSQLITSVLGRLVALTNASLSKFAYMNTDDGMVWKIS
jgi:hypothetical protein